ncbi:MAG: hypothetical protein LBK95_11315 [Bifidobacteriaceae bacterium]|jgi:hypothetical protein|nr:hypothetical protein [Bifidobacteriaceae bacterium]
MPRPRSADRPDSAWVGLGAPTAEGCDASRAGRSRQANRANQADPAGRAEQAPPAGQAAAAVPAGRAGRRRPGPPAGRRLVLAAWIAATFTLVMPNMAQAYIDPATTSSLIQVVSGLVITLSVAIGVFFRRIVLGLTALRARAGAWWAIATSPDRGELRRKRRQERADRKTEAAGIEAGGAILETVSARAARLLAERLTAAGGQATGPAFGFIPAAGAEGSAGDSGAGLLGAPNTIDRGRRPGGIVGVKPSVRANQRHPDLAVSKAQFLWRDSRRFRRRLAIALTTGLAAPFLFFGFGFLDLYLRNPSEFPFSFGQLALPTLGLAAGIGLLIAAVLVILRGRVFDLAVSLVLGVTLAAWVQANFLNLDYGELNGVAIRWEHYTRWAVVDTAIWLALIAAPVVLRLVSRKIWNLAAWLFPTAVIAAGTVGLVATYSGADIKPWEPPSADFPTFEGAFTASAGPNQYIFVLDMMDQHFVEDIRREYPDFFESNLDGFTEFDNHISNYSRTLPSAVDMLTGERYQFDEPVAQYTARAYQKGTFLPSLRAAGYSTSIYATNRYSYTYIEDIEELADNIRPAVMDVPELVMLKGTARLAGFRYAPHIFKPTFWTPVEPFARVKPDLSTVDPFSNGNVEFYSRLKASGLSLDGAQPRFSYVHLDGAHNPARINAEVEPVPVDSVPLEVQAKGAFKIVFDYLEELRRLGRYKDASIVITADHGQWLGRDDPPRPQPRLTSLFVKPAGVEGAPLAHSDVPTDPANVRATLLADAGVEDPDGFPTVFEVPLDSDRVRDFYYRRGQNVDEGLIDHWQVRGDARDFGNWEFIGETRTTHWG